ncbi:serine hydrolase domain-containing protein [Lysobacter korlensis]|uniref:Serine hydrolase domain-containing protein n=1 Tax=Lysobacter korlensis TaxID=553636 RepID=A0ABV6RI67_9GAMM
MHRAIPFISAALAVTAAVSGSANPLAAGARVDGRHIADRLFAALVEANGVPGMGAAVVLDGAVVWTGSTGMRDVEAGLPVDPNTVFRLASVSKLVTATAAAKLGEAGRLDLDAPVQSTLPWLRAHWAPLTARQLAAHTAGLPHYQDIDQGLGAQHYATVRDAVGIFEGRPLLTAPDSAYHYSSWGYTLLSAVVEAGAGEPFLDYVGREVAPGLGIGAVAPNDNNPDASATYGFVDGTAARLPAHDFSYTWGGGGLAATPRSIALFGSRAVDGTIVSRATFDAMLQPARLSDGSTVRERDYEVGFGWRAGRDIDGNPIAHHAGTTVAARSALVVWPTRGVSASVLSNAQWTSSIERTAEMLAAPFHTRPTADRQGGASCPVDAVAYEAEFEGARFNGTATFTDQDGLCSGRITLTEGPLRTWLNGFPQRDADALDIIGVHPRAGISRAALVTPIGLHDLRTDIDGRTLRVNFGPNRSLVVRLNAKAATAVKSG